MKLVRAVSCWGNEATPLEALGLAKSWGFEAIEGQLTDELLLPAEDAGKSLIVEISTCCPPGSYVPSLRATPADHLEDFRRKLDAALLLNPIKVTTLTGSDFWEFPTNIRFFEELLEITCSAGTQVCIETHRSRPTFHPLQTARLLTELPELNLTLDLSHWCVVCERGLATMLEWMLSIERRVGHVHARVGYDQGPQVPNPQSPWHREDLASHLACWTRIAHSQEIFTITPEFGPDGYLHVDPRNGLPLANLRRLNYWMGETLKLELNKPV